MDYFNFHTDKHDQFEWSTDLSIIGSEAQPSNGYGVGLFGGFGEMVFRCLDFSKHGFSLWINKYDIREKQRYFASMDAGDFELNIQLLNQERFTLNGNEFSMRSGQYNFYYLPFVDNVVEFQKGQQYVTLDIHYSKDYIQAKSNILPDILGPMLEDAMNGRGTKLLPVSVFMPPDIQFLVRGVLRMAENPQRNTDVLIVYAVQYLTVRLLTHGWELKNGSFLPFAKSRNISLAERTLLDDLRNFTSLSRLCRIAAVNRNDLERYFHQNFQKSIYGYWNDYRLTMAFETIVQSDKTLQEVSEDYGFQDHSSFTRAFKNRFKITPSDLRKSKK